jgi:hypothetical protein
MSANRPPAIDLKALQNRLDDLNDQRPVEPAPRPGDGDGAAAIETAVRGNGHVGVDGEGQNAAIADELEAGLPVPRLGAEAAANMTKLSKAAAEDIRQLGRLAFNAGKRVQEECEQMASDVEANGGTVALQLTGLSQLLADVGMSNRETLHRLLGGASPSIVPSTGNGHAAEQALGEAKAMRTAPLDKTSPRANDA